MARNGAISIDRPTSEQIERALARIAASEALRASPQLVAFLRYVVTTTLAGQENRIKGHTIAVEALAREADFDPQTDPIVRVEAGRLRRALHRYYAEEGVDEELVIALPRGSYVPEFQRQGGDPDTPDPSPTPDAPAPVPTPAPPGWRFYATAIATPVLIACIGIAAFASRPVGDVPTTGSVPRPAAAPAARLIGSPMPIVVARTFDEIGSARNTDTLDRLHLKLREALARRWVPMAIIPKFSSKLC